MGRTKTACLQIERGEIGFKVDVKPFATGGSRVDYGEPNEFIPDSLTLTAASRLRIDQECVICAVLGDVHESDQDAVMIAGADPPQAVRTDPAPPSGTRGPAVGDD